MLKTGVIAIIIALAMSTVSLAEFPAEELWSIQVDTLPRCLGPSWEEDGRFCFLVGLNNRVLIVSEGEMIWESDRLPEKVLHVNRLDYGLEHGPEIVVVTDSIENPSMHYIRIYHFFGENYSQEINRRLFSNYYPDERRIPFPVYSVTNTEVLNSLLPDSNRTTVLGKRITYRSNDGGSNRGETILFPNVDNINGIRGGVVTNSFKVTQDDHEFLYLTYWTNSSNSGLEIPTRIRGNCGVQLIDDGLNLISDQILAEYAFVGADINPRERAKILDFYGKTLRDSLHLYVAYVDSSEDVFVSRLSANDLESVHTIRLPMSVYVIGHGSIREEEQLVDGLLCLNEGRVFVLNAEDLSMLTEMEHDLPNYYYGGVGYLAKLGDFDEDDELEFIMVGQRLGRQNVHHVRFFDIGPLSVPAHSQPYIPESYSISAAYPNPFNSQAMIEYTLPRAGRYALVVYDVNGTEITRLADEWNTAGTYYQMWEAQGIPSGNYLINLENESQNTTKSIQLIK